MSSPGARACPAAAAARRRAPPASRQTRPRTWGRAEPPVGRTLPRTVQRARPPPAPRHTPCRAGGPRQEGTLGRPGSRSSARASASRGCGLRAGFLAPQDPGRWWAGVPTAPAPGRPPSGPLCFSRPTLGAGLASLSAPGSCLQLQRPQPAPNGSHQSPMAPASPQRPQPAPRAAPTNPQRPPTNPQRPQPAPNGPLQSPAAPHQVPMAPASPQRPWTTLDWVLTSSHPGVGRLPRGSRG